MEEKPTVATVKFIDDRAQIAKNGIETAVKAMKEILAEKVIQNGSRSNSQHILGKLEEFSDLFLKLDKAVHHAYGPKPEVEVQPDETASVEYPLSLPPETGSGGTP